jgi:PLD-like domain
MEILLENWIERFREELHNVNSLKIISPFVGEDMCNTLIQDFNIDSVELITRFNIRDWAIGVSSINGIEMLFSDGVKIFGVKDLHSKVYIFDDSKAIVTSANFTNGGLINNYECGILIDDRETIVELCNYFESLKVEEPLHQDLLERFFNEISIAKMQLQVIPNFNDFGDSLLEEEIVNVADVFFINMGTHFRHRTIESNFKYGFISAGQHPKHSNQIRRSEIVVGTPILAYTKRYSERNHGGYIGFGFVTEIATPIDKFLLNNGSDLRGRDFVNAELFDNHDNENSEYCIRIKWEKRLTIDTCIWRTNIFRCVGTACSMFNQSDDVKFILDEMGINYLQ